ncbi:hypothetical protein RRG08_056721 [Elysia crispata]|uniref:Uncharacterized protein n=1 Tax=Elysia crispata TaxID=231223 RepID=A0AAE1CYQ7_9GAST|nr:hypothetical protein RRG08_056721 [Elysia crispata]
MLSANERTVTEGLSVPLRETLHSTVKTANYVKRSRLNTRLFHDSCSDTSARHQALLLYTQVRCLSKRKPCSLCRVFELRQDIKFFLEVQGKVNFLPLSNPRNELDVAGDMRFALSKTSPRISRLVSELQAHSSVVLALPLPPADQAECPSNTCDRKPGSR